MRKFIVKTFISALVALIILSGLGILADAGIRKSKDNEYCEIHNGKIDADLLICGSSRAWVHISPQIIDSAFNINSYNIGLDGQPYPLQIAKYNFYTEYNQKPKYIIYETDELSFITRKDLYNTNLYLPFLKDTALTATLKNYEEGYNDIDFYNPFTKYMGKPGRIIWGILQFFDIKYAGYNTKIKGYEASSRGWDNSFDEFRKQNPNGIKQPYSQDLFEVFENFVNDRKKENINIAFVWTPQYFEYTEMLLNKDEILNYYKRLSIKYDIPFLDYSNDSICFQKKYFYNSQHLNKMGAELLSRRLAEDLKQIHFIK